MEERKTAVKKRIQFAAIGTALLAVILLFAVFAGKYIRKFDSTLKEENQAHLSEVADHIVAYIQTVVEDTQMSLETAANALTAIPEEKRMNYLEDMARRHEFAYMGYSEADGRMHATDSSRDMDISGESYFQAAMRGENEISGLVRHILKNNAVSGILMSVPCWDGSGNPSGVLVAMLDVARLQKALGVDSFEGEGYSYIIDVEGNLVLHNKSMDYNNFFRVLDNVEIQEGHELSMVKEDVKAGSPGMILYEQLGTSQYAYYSPLGLNSWTVVNIVSREAATSKTDTLTKELVFISVSAGVVFLALLGTACILWMFSQNRRHASEAKADFLANISHEIRTPMNAIVGMGELLMRSPLNGKQKEYVKSILNSGKGLLAIINDVLDFSKIESGKFTILNEEYGTEELLYDLIYMAAIRIGDKPVYFVVDIDESVPARLIGDATRVKQILANLVSNAAKFTEEGYIRLTIRCQREENKQRLVLKVEDTGIGIKKQDMEKLFISFSQIDSRYNHGNEGTGLGLVITNALCQMMNGDVTVESEYGKGSVFTASIMQENVESEILVENKYHQPGRILILETSLFLQKFYKDYLERMGLSYQFYTEYSEFEEAAVSGEYTVVMADRASIFRLEQKIVPKKVAVITLLQIQEHTLMSVQGQDSTVFVPLFGLQLAVQLKRLSGEKAVVKSAFLAESIKILPNVNVLLVDDNDLNLQIAEELMKPYKMHVDCVHSGQEAVDVVRGKEYDLIFMDYMMPGMDGTEALKKIRALPGKYFASLPVVALTANASNSAQAMFLMEGFNDFLAKPIMLQKLDEVLMKWLAPVNEKRMK